MVVLPWEIAALTILNLLFFKCAPSPRFGQQKSIRAHDFISFYHISQKMPSFGAKNRQSILLYMY